MSTSPRGTPGFPATPVSPTSTRTVFEELARRIEEGKNEIRGTMGTVVTEMQAKIKEMSTDTDQLRAAGQSIYEKMEKIKRSR